MQHKPAKERSSDGGPTASPMIKSAKDGEDGVESSHGWNYIPALMGVSP